MPNPSTRRRNITNSRQPNTRQRVRHIYLPPSPTFYHQLRHAHINKTATSHAPLRPHPTPFGEDPLSSRFDQLLWTHSACLTYTDRNTHHTYKHTSRNTATMGLSLHNSADALNPLSQGPSQVTHPRTRAHYKGAFLRADGSLSLNREYADQRFHLLDLVLHANHQRRAQRHRTRRRQQTNRSIQQWRSDQTDEGRELAALAGVRVPGEAPQRRRTPSLERQGAFRLSGTTRSRIQQDEEGLDDLYRLGLLYDDEHLRGEGFELGSIAHPEPEYTVRPAKRARGSQAQRRSYEDDLQLALDLSLAELGRDESFARYLCSPDLDEPPSEDDDSSDFTTSQFDSGLLSPPDSDTENTPDLTTDSDSDRLSLSSFTSSSEQQHWAATRPRSRRGRAAADHGVSDNAWMVLGDGS